MRDITAIGHVCQACLQESKKITLACVAQQIIINSDHSCMTIVPLKMMSADHVRRYSTDRNFSGNSADPDQISQFHFHYAHGSHSLEKAWNF